VNDRPDDHGEVTRVAVLTARGRGAIAVVRVWGERAVAIADSVFRPFRGSRLSNAPVGRLRLGRIGRGQGDEVLAVVMAGHPQEVEVQCHGGPAAIELVVEALVEAGAERSTPDRWVQDRSETPIRAAALSDLVRAPTFRAASLLLDQSTGALERELGGCLDSIRSGEDRSAAEVLTTLADRGKVGTRLLEGWKVVLCGRPNVGKSRLLNALAGYTRAIVSPSPGTTRDVVSVRTALDGWPVELADTAGLRQTDDEIENLGIELAGRWIASADLVIAVLDRSTSLKPSDRAVLELRGRRVLLVANKSDLPAAWDAAAIPGVGRGAIPISAERGDGLDRLIEAIVGQLVPSPPQPGEGVPFRSDQLQVIEQVSEALKAAGGRNRAMELIEQLLARREGSCVGASVKNRPGVGRGLP